MPQFVLQDIVQSDRVALKCRSLARQPTETSPRVTPCHEFANAALRISFKANHAYSHSRFFHTKMISTCTVSFSARLAPAGELGYPQSPCRAVSSNGLQAGHPIYEDTAAAFRSWPCGWSLRCARSARRNGRRSPRSRRCWESINWGRQSGPESTTRRLMPASVWGSRLIWPRRARLLSR